MCRVARRSRGIPADLGRGRDGCAATISACAITDALSGTCTPTQIVQPASEVDFLNLREMRVEGSALYAAGDGDGATSVWRIQL